MKLKIQLIFFGLISFILFSKDTQAQVIINELIASNSSVISDPDFDDTGDWIELYNNSNIAIDLSDYSLTDNLGQFDKWKFPVGTQIGANGHLLIWADGNDVGLHTNFKLSAAGEEIGLYNSQGTLLDSVIYQNMLTDVSFGRKTDANITWGFFSIPTPGFYNNTVAYDGIVFYQPKFSVRGGFYDDSFEVVLDAIDGEVRYTTDGSFPSITSSIFTGPISINSTTILRAAVFLPNFIQGKTATQSYFINEDLEARKLPVISIATNPEYFWSNDIGLYVQDFKPEWKYPINIELFENDGGDRAAFNELAGVKVNGLNSWVLPQKMLGIYFDNEYDQNNLEYPLFFDRQRNRYDNFTLRVSGSDWSQTMMRDGLSQSLTIGITDLGQMGFRPSIVFVNGEYLGIHNIRSRVDESYIEDNYGWSGSEYDLIENNGVVEQGDDIAFNEFMDLLNQDLSIQSNYNAVAAVMDIENCIDFYVTEMWTGNSSFGHNVQFWKPRVFGSKWRWIAQDFDRGFIGADSDLFDYFTDTNNGAYGWINSRFLNLIQNQEFADAFVARFADHLFTTYHPTRVEQFITKFESNIENEMPYHIARWLGTTSGYGNAIPSFGYWKDQVAQLRNYNQARPGFLYDNIIDNFDVQEKVTLGVNSFPENGGQVFINDLEIPASSWLGNYFTNVPFELRAEPLAGHEFQGWSEIVIDTLIAKESTWKYFDLGINPGNDWATNIYDDSSWEVGQAQLGYGDGDENTIVSYGGNSNDKHITTYFRKSFTVNNVSDLSNQMYLNLMRDDAAIVYLNGEEVIRSNMAEGSVNFLTPALTYVSGVEEDLYFSFQINENVLLEGENLITVEIHQAYETSSDISFDLELIGLRNTSEFISTNPIPQVNLDRDKIFSTKYLQTSTCILPDIISENTILTIDCSPYLVRENVVILPNRTLTVEAGVEIQFPKGGNMMVQGNLRIKGREGELVRFLPNESLGTIEWGHVFFENATDTSSLVWFEIIGASQGAHPLRENAALAIWNSVLEMDHVVLENVNGNPISARYSDVWLKNSSLRSKVTGDLINVKYGYGFIDSCEFQGNTQIDTDAIDYDDVKNGVIMNSKIYDFLGFNSDAIDLGEGSSDIIVENNFIHHISDKGISIGQNSSVFLKNNTFVECTQGIGIKDEGFASVEQTTFYNNSNDIVAFEKNIGSGGGFVEAYNNIFSNTVFDPISLDANSDVQVNYSLSDTDSLLGSNILLVDPLFENPTQNNFQLQPISPAINTGVNSVGVIDLGTSDHFYSAKPSILISAIHYNPADTSLSEFLEIYNPSDKAIFLNGYSFVDGIIYSFLWNVVISSGEKIRIVKDVSFHTDYVGQIFQWNSGSLSNNGEKIILQDALGVVVDHVQYDDKLPWPTEADGEGAFLELVNVNLDNHFGKNWIPNFKTSIDEVVDEEDSIIIFPNPTSDFLIIKTTESWMKKVSLFDALGRNLVTQYPNGNEVNINLTLFPTGIYFIKINDSIIRRVIRGN
jgi:hypothetical protein